MDTINSTSALDMESDMSPTGLELETYSIVLSIATLTLSVVFGTGGNILIFLSMCTNKLLRKSKYAQLSCLLLICLLFDLIWAPMEIGHLIYFHKHSVPLDGLKLASQSLYMLLISAIALTLTLLVAFRFLLICGKCTRRLKKLSAFIGLPVDIVTSFALSLVYGIISVSHEPDMPECYVIMNKTTFLFKVVLITIYIFSLGTLLLGMPAHARWGQFKSNNDDKISTASSTPIEPPYVVPQLDIGNTIEDDMSGEEADTMPSPMKKNTSSSKINAQKGSPAAPKTSLQVNFLPPSHGRRRHTICQIGNSAMDPQLKALQYNYVRKWSVDITALQAQLENPKIHGSDKAFESSTEEDVGEKKDHDANGSLIIEPVTPDDVKKDGPQHLPLIMLNDSMEVSSVDDVDSNKITMKGSKHAFKFSYLLSANFILCILPMYITDALRDKLSHNAYVNIITCTTALSIIQTIIYPYIIICLDSTVNKYAHKFFSQLRQCFSKQQQERQQMLQHSDQSDLTSTQV